MASLSTATDGEITEFKGRLARAGLTAELLREVNHHDYLAPIMVEALKRNYRYTTLIHEVFNRQDSVLAAFKARCAEKGIDFGKFTWVGSEQAPEFDPNDPETVVVLDATLSTLQKTFEFAWAWTVDGQEDKWRWPSLDSSPKKLALLDGIEFKAWTLKWIRIKLDANIGKRPSTVRKRNTTPGCALLFMSAEHPERIKATDSEKRFGFYLRGLKCTVPGLGPWAGVPCVDFGRDDRRVLLNVGWCGSGRSDLAVPVLRE